MQWQKHRLCATIRMMDMYKHTYTYYTQQDTCASGSLALADVLHIAHCTCSCEDGIGTTQFHVLYVQLLEFM